MDNLILVVGIDFDIKPNTLGFVIANEALNSIDAETTMNLVTHQIYNSIDNSSFYTDNLNHNVLNFIKRLVFFLEGRAFAINISRVNSELPTINITLHIENDNLSQILDELLDKIIFNYDQLESCGLSQEIGEIDLMLYNYYCSSILLQKSILDKILFLHKGFPSLSTNSYTNNNIEKLDKYIDEHYEYNQLIFTEISSDEDINSIIALWKEKSNDKYFLFQKWNKNVQKKKLTLNIEINTYINYDILFSDLIDFVNYLKHKFIITFGVYHYEYDGGEIGSEILLALIKNNIDLLITKSLVPPCCPSQEIKRLSLASCE